MKQQHCLMCGKDLGMVNNARMYCVSCAAIHQRESSTSNEKYLRRITSSPSTNRGAWTPEEVEFLKQNYKPREFSILAVCKSLNRSYSSVKNKVHIMKRDGQL